MAHAPHTTSRRTTRAALAAAACVALALVLAPAASAAAVPAVTTATATPAAFVPNWDGHTDGTVVQYQLTERSSVRVRILDRRGRVVATIDAGRREAGMHLVSWDGRAGNGRVLRAGRYRVRVDARPVPPAQRPGQPGSAAMGGVVAVAGARAAAITLQSPPVALTGVRLGRAAIGRSKRASRTSVRFDLSSAASISAAIVGSDGRALRTLAARRMRAGANTLAWDGRGRSRRPLPDGEYTLLVAASGGGRPTATTRLPVRIDRTVPRLRMSSRIRAGATASGIRIPFTMTLTEPTTVVVRYGRRSVRRTARAGTQRIVVPANELGIVGTRRARAVRVLLVVSDDAGNSVVRRATVTVPPVTRIQPRPVTQPPKPQSPGAFPWPVAGIVTSEFGPRGGRLHAGLDIAMPSGSPIHPVAPGTVSYVGVLGGYGNLVMVDHAGGLRTYYAHMERFGAFGVGDAVQPLDVLGFVGCTGSCSGPHVHFETRVNDVPQDPRRWLAPG